MKRIYLDHNATTPLAAEALDAMLPFMREDYGNPSSMHWYGQRARSAAEQAREQVAKLINAEASEIVFTASGTESDNMALRGVAARASEPRRRILTTPVEHHAVVHTVGALGDEGYPVEFLAVDGDGRLDLDALERTLDERTALVSVMLANNETGVVQPVREAARLAHRAGALRALRCGAGRRQAGRGRGRARCGPAHALRAQDLRTQGRGLLSMSAAAPPWPRWCEAAARSATGAPARPTCPG